MTAPVAASGVDGFLARYAALREQLPDAATTRDATTRDAAAASFKASGLPGRRDEAWKYTDLRLVATAAFGVPLTTAGDSTKLARLPRLDAPRLVFVDGQFSPALSSLPTAVAVDSFAHLEQFGGADFGTLARPDRDPLVALNTMLATDGALITVPDGVDGGTLQLVSIASAGQGHPVAFHPRHAVRLARGARLTLLEIGVGDGTYLHNPVTEVRVAEAAVLTHVRLQDESVTAFSLATLYAEVAEGGTYDSFTLSLGARLARTEIHAVLAGPRSLTHLNGAQLLAGQQHADFTSVVRHAAPHGTSRQTVKNVLTGRARAVFQGRIEVARVAQKTDGYQMSQSLLLSPDAEIDTKPELEIFADDVKCSHGATVGELDADQLFYLKARGIPDAAAREILVRAFLVEALDAVADDAIRAVLETSVEHWWKRQVA